MSVEKHWKWWVCGVVVATGKGGRVGREKSQVRTVSSPTVSHSPLNQWNWGRFH